VILARASSVKGSTVRHNLDLGAVVAVCWNCDSAYADRSRAWSRPACRSGVVLAITEDGETAELWRAELVAGRLLEPSE
jgi:hypothetical protein